MHEGGHLGLGADCVDVENGVKSCLVLEVNEGFADGRVVWVEWD